MFYNLKEGQYGKLWYKGEWIANKPHGRGIEQFKLRSGENDRMYDGQF